MSVIENWKLKLCIDCYKTIILCLELLEAAVIVHMLKLGHMVVRNVAKMVCTLLQLERYKWID